MQTIQETKVKKQSCPECGSKAVHRSQMRGFVERGVLKLIGVRAYRCESCDQRYYEFKRIEFGAEKLGR